MFEVFIERASLIAQLVKNLPATQETPVQFLGQEDHLEKGLGYPLQYSWAFLVAQLVRNLPAMQETWVRSLGWDNIAYNIKHYSLKPHRAYVTYVKSI